MNRFSWIAGPVTRLLGIGFCAGTLISCSATDNGSVPSTQPTPSVSSGETVRVKAVATDDGPVDQLHYQWAATDGQVKNVDSATTEWTLPPSSGLHFLYVQVSDGKGGYRERRLAILTGSTAPESEATTPSTSGGGAISLGSSLFYKPAGVDRSIYLRDINLLQGTTNLGTTDFKGNVRVSGQQGDVTCALGTQSIGKCLTIGNSTAFARAGQGITTWPTSRIIGHIQLRDGSYCGIHSEFFSPADRLCTVELWNQTKTTRLAGPFSINGYGDFFLPHTEPGGRLGVIRILQESEVIHEFNVTVSGEETVVAAVEIQNQAPEVTITATSSNGGRVERPDMPDLPFGLPEMDRPVGDDIFLTFRGKDTRQSACAYYTAIGAVQSCGDDGTPQGAITLDSWKREHQLEPYNDSVVEHKATYINLYDLNLVRDMHAVKVDDDHIAFNVCNFPGPLDTGGIGAPLKPGEEGQQNIDLAITFAQNKKIGMLGCVAMDYWKSGDAAPFVKFYSFGPSGKLLLSVSLDGRREKFMPGTCVACHGGSNYAGRYPVAGGPANIRSHFMPFDLENFAFSSQPGLTEADQQAKFKILNDLVRLVEERNTSDFASEAIASLIKAWYPPDTVSFTKNYVPDGWNNNSDDRVFYSQILARSCRTCHIAHIRSGRDSQDGNFERGPESVNPISMLFDSVCGKTSDVSFNHAMPNALVPAYRLWHTSQRNVLIDYADKKTTTGVSPCGTAPHPHP